MLHVDPTLQSPCVSPIAVYLHMQQHVYHAVACQYVVLYDPLCSHGVHAVMYKPSHVQKYDSVPVPPVIAAIVCVCATERALGWCLVGTSSCS